MEITYEYVREIFDYDAEGYLVWTKAARNQHVDKKAGYERKQDGYWVIELFQNKKQIGAHRLIFLWHYGYLPVMVDHVNRVKTDNRIENLREANPTQQNANKIISPLNTTKFKGVEYDKKRNKYRARIRAYGKRTNLGRFDTPEEAHAAYMQAAKELFGGYACSG